VKSFTSAIAAALCFATLHAYAQSSPTQIATLASAAAPGSVVVARSGGVAAAVCADGRLRVWTLPEGTPLPSIDLGKRDIYTMAISPDGRTIVAGDYSGDYSFWQSSSGTEQTHFRLGFYPTALAFSADGSRLAIAPVGEPVQIYDVAAGRKLLELQQRPVGGTAALAFARDGSRLVAAGADTVVRLYDARTGELLKSNTEFLSEPLAASFSADGQQLFTGGADKWVATLDVASGKTARKSGKLDDPVSALDVSPDGALVATLLMHADNMTMPAPVIVSETATGRRITQWMPAGLVRWSGWTDDGRLLAATADDRAIHLWRVR
jgi:WD40 repeat protein